MEVVVSAFNQEKALVGAFTNLRLSSGKRKQTQLIAAFLLTFCTFALIPAAEDVYLLCLVWAMQGPGHYASKYPDRQMVTCPGLDNRSS